MKLYTYFTLHPVVHRLLKKNKNINKKKRTKIGKQLILTPVSSPASPYLPAHVHAANLYI